MFDIIGGFTVVKQVIHRTGYHGERSADFVRYVGKEPQFHFRHFFLQRHIGFEVIKRQYYSEEKVQKSNCEKNVKQSCKSSLPE